MTKHLIQGWIFTLKSLSLVVTDYSDNNIKTTSPDPTALLLVRFCRCKCMCECKFVCEIISACLLVCVLPSKELIWTGSKQVGEKERGEVRGTCKWDLLKQIERRQLSDTVDFVRGSLWSDVESDFTTVFSVSSLCWGASWSEDPIWFFSSAKLGPETERNPSPQLKNHNSVW